MATPHLSVREIEAGDIPLITRYWLTADVELLLGMGVDLAKMPTETEWHLMLNEQLSTPHPHKKSWCIIWLIDGMPSGHSNINKIVPGEEAYMHLHLWHATSRQQGVGTTFVRLTIPFFFDTYRLERLCCQPYALNAAPNKTLEKVGFEFVRQEVTTPGWINFEQQVNLWVMSRERYTAL